MSRATLPPDPAPARLHRFLQACEVPECDCPLTLSCPCGQGCPGGRLVDDRGHLGPYCHHCAEACGCPPLIGQELCPHSRPFLDLWPEAEDAARTRRWAEMLGADDPKQHAEPKAIPRPALRILTRAGRVAIYSEREAARKKAVKATGQVSAGTGLWNGADLWRTQPTDDDIQAGVVAENSANGAPVVEQQLTTRRRE